MNLEGVFISKIFRINDQIRAREVHLIDEESKSHGTVSLDQAKVVAFQRGYDLVEVTARTYPPIVRLLDFGKFKYQQEKSEKKNKQKRTDLKEVRLKLNIEPRDLEVKTAKIKDFLEKGHKVRVTLVLRGREMAFMPKAYEFINKIKASLGEEIKQDKSPQRMGNRISAIFVKGAK